MLYRDCRILVVGSLNMDLTVRCPYIPAPGETILGSSLVESPGGKGANQAVAAGRLGGNVAMIGCVGTDAFGRALRSQLRASNVADKCVFDRGERSGVALIEVGDDGENSIVVVPGANALLEPADVERALAAAPQARALLLQLEIPLRTVEAAASLGRARGLKVLLDPAPPQLLSDALLSHIDFLLPNQHEAAILAEMPVTSQDEALAVARRLLGRGPQAVLVKLGADGVLLVERSGATHIPGCGVKSVDTTAAGDCLAGAFAVALVEGLPLPNAATFANQAAALSTTKPGAQTSLPARADLERFGQAGHCS